jgi:acyl-CoA thioesterase
MSTDCPGPLAYDRHMGDLHRDAELAEIAPGRFERMLSRQWEIWGPNGGYLAALALDAARRLSQRARPANATVHFLGVASFDEPVSVTAEVLRSTRQATSVLARIEQSGKPIAAAMIWALDDGLDGLVHDDAPMPDVPSWKVSPTIREWFARDGVEPPENRYEFWNNFEQRPPSWIVDWENRTPARPLYQDWLRFTDGGSTSDPWLQAARLLLLVDLGGWPAIGRRHLETNWMAPTLDVSCEFHRLTTGDEWFFLQGESPFAGDGLVASRQHVWNDRGELLASGISHLLCRKLA